MVKDTSPGMTLVAPGVAWMYPTVPTSPLASVRQNSSIAPMHSAAPRVAAKRHRHRAGVPGHAGQPRGKPCRTSDRADHTDGQVLSFQHRPLLDVQFEIGKQLAPRPRRRADMIGVEAERDERIAHRHALAVARVQNSLVERAGHRTAAEERRSETDPLFISKADDLDRERQALAVAVEVCDAGDGRDHAERPVPFAGIAHRVVMRAEHQTGRTRLLALIAAADIADRIKMRIHAGLAHPAQD